MHSMARGSLFRIARTIVLVALAMLSFGCASVEGRGERSLRHFSSMDDFEIWRARFRAVQLRREDAYRAAAVRQANRKACVPGKAKKANKSCRWLEEVIVTGQRRLETFEEAAVPVTVFESQSLTNNQERGADEGD